MYAVIYDNKVLVGPMNWNRGMFQGALEKKGISYELSRTAPNNLPLIIDEHAKIMRVDEIRPEMNPLLEFYYGPLWDITEETAIANYEVHDSPIESMRYNLKQLAAQERYNKEVLGTTVIIQDHVVTIDTNRGARDVFVQKYLLMADSDLVNWKFLSTWLTLTKQDLGLIVQVIDQHVQTCFDWEADISNQLDLADTKQALLAVAINTNIFKELIKPSPEVTLIGT
jgi:hypothetical protein